MEDAAEGQGRILLVEGPVASGKSELLRIAAERAADSGFPFVEATCSRAEQALPLGVVGQLIRHSAFDREVSQQAAQRLESVRDGGGEAELVAALDTVCTALLDLATDTPVVVGIDDLRHADPASSRFLLHLARRVRTARILLVLTDDSEPPQRNAPFHAELRRQPPFRRMHLTPLSADDVTRHLVRHFGEARAERLGPEVFAASGGNPVLLRAIVEDRENGQGEQAPSYGPALLSCLHCSEPIMLQVVRALAVLGQDGSRVAVRELLDADDGDVGLALDALNASGLLGNDRIRLPAGRSAVLDDLPQAVRAELHHRAARLLHDRDTPVRRVARHLVEANQAGARWEIQALREAAEEALAGDEPSPAVAALTLAYAAATDDVERASLLARLAQAEWQLNPAAAARHLGLLSAAARAGQLDRRDCLQLVRQLLWHGRTAEAIDVLDRIRDTANVAPAAAIDVSASVTAELQAAELWLTGSHPALARKRSMPPAPARSMTPGMDPALRSTAMLADVLSHGRSRDAVGAALQVLHNVELSHGLSWADESAVFALLVLISANRTDTAAQWCDRMLAQDRAHRSPTWQAMFTAARSVIALRQGDLPAAAELGREALTHLAPKAWGVAVGFPLGSLLLATTRLGKYREAAKLLTRSVPEAMFETRYGLPYLYARGDYYLNTGHHHAALADFLACGKLVRRWGLDGAGLVPWHAGAAETWLRLGDEDQARRLIYDELARSGVDGSPGRGAALRVLAELSPLKRRLRLLTEALGQLEVAGDRFEQARVLTGLGRTQHALGDIRRSRTSFRRAWHIAKMCEAAPLTQELLSISGAADETGPDIPTSAPTGGITALTDSERRVASLAVLGYTNREIAAKLRVTASTVEQHLTRVYRKLDVKSRDNLPVELRLLVGNTA